MLNQEQLKLQNKILELLKGNSFIVIERILDSVSVRYKDNLLFE